MSMDPALEDDVKAEPMYIKPEQELLGAREGDEEAGARDPGCATSDAAPNGPKREKHEAEQGGESSGNNASNGTTQKVDKAEEAAAEASTAPKAPSDDLHELANRGLCAPLWRTARPSQSGIGVPDVDQLQTGWCNYAGSAVQKVASWSAALSPMVQSKLAQQQQLLGASVPISLGTGRGQLGTRGLAPASRGEQFGPPLHYKHHSAPLEEESFKVSQQQAETASPGVFTAKPPGISMPALPTSPFSKSAIPMSPFHATPGERGNTLQNVLSGDSPFTPSTQTKFHWPEDAQSPRQSTSDGNQKTEAPAQNNSLTRQVSLPDFGELADLWTEMSNAPEDYNLDLDTLPSLPKDSALSLSLPRQLSFGLRQTSLAKMGRAGQEQQIPVGNLLNDIKSHRRNRSMRFNSALTWQPGTAADALPQGRRNSGRLQSLQMVPPNRDGFNPPDRSSSSGFHPAGVQRGPELPDQVHLSIVNAPSIFAVPTCINKTFKPPFTVRVTIVSSRQMQIKATVAAYTLQREQVAKLDQWHPSQHVFTELLAGSIVSESVTCEGPEDGKSGEIYSGKHVGSSDLVFTDLKFNASSRMKPRWVVFALALPTDDVLFVQYTVPTIVMSRQCDQTPRAQSILRGEVPTRKRARQHESTEGHRSKMSYSGLSPTPSASTPPSRPPAVQTPITNTFMASPVLAGRPGIQPADQGSINVGSLYTEEGDWPQRGPFTMAKWREAIVKVCREYGLTRSFEQEDMHELAKVAGFMGSPQLGNQQVSVLHAHQWNAFGRWFLSYLHIFKDLRDLWMSPSIVCICSFSATRERAEQLLMAQPEGTFLLRPSLSMDATLVISLAVANQTYHLAVDGLQLERRPLEEWLADLPDAAFLLDINSGIRYPKHHIFPCRRIMPPQDLIGFPNPLLPSARMISQQPQQGTDALAHIIEASRRSGGSFPPPLGQYGHGQAALGHIPSIAGPGGDHLGQLFDQWGSMDLRADHFRGQNIGSLDAHTGALSLPPGAAHNMRFGGH